MQCAWWGEGWGSGLLGSEGGGAGDLDSWSWRIRLKPDPGGLRTKQNSRARCSENLDWSGLEEPTSGF